MRLGQASRIKMREILASPIEWSYLAGIIDGEGCVRATETKACTKRRKFNLAPRFQIKLAIYNSSEHLISWITKTFGGSLYLHAKPGQKGGQGIVATKNGWQITWTGGECENILNHVHPYLIVKKYQAELCFKLREMTLSNSPKNTHKFGERLSDEKLSERRAVLQALKDAKKTQ